MSEPKGPFDNFRDAIIAKLRAADKLYKAAKDNVEKCSCNFGGLDEEGRPFGKQPCDQCDPLCKAIADYEGKRVLNSLDYQAVFGSTPEKEG